MEMLRFFCSNCNENNKFPFSHNNLALSLSLTTNEFFRKTFTLSRSRSLLTILFFRTIRNLYRIYSHHTTTLNVPILECFPPLPSNGFPRRKEKQHVGAGKKVARKLPSSAKDTQCVLFENEKLNFSSVVALEISTPTKSLLRSLAHIFFSPFHFLH